MSRLSVMLVDITAFSTPVVASSRQVAFERTMRGRNRRSFAQRMVRPLTDDEMVAILPLARDLEPVSPPPEGLWEDGDGFDFDYVRDRRDGRLQAVLRSQMQRAQARLSYDNRCLLTRTRFELAPGRFEAEWSHWQPAHLNGPDILANASMLSRTAHALVENGHAGLTSDYRLAGTPEALDMLRAHNPELQPALPSDRDHWPAQRYLGWHRDRHGSRNRWVEAAFFASP